MKKFITLLLSFILILTASVPPVFADEFYTSSNDHIHLFFHLKVGTF